MDYLEGNRDFAINFVKENISAIRLNKIEATFLMWMDCGALPISESPAEFFAREAHVQLNDGAAFGAGYEKYVRLNLGTNRDTLSKALENMRKALH